MNPFYALLLLFVQNYAALDHCKAPDSVPTYTVREALDQRTLEKLNVLRTTSGRPVVELAVSQETGKIVFAYTELDGKWTILGRWTTLHLAAFEGPWTKRIMEIMDEVEDVNEFRLSRDLICQLDYYTGPH